MNNKRKISIFTMFVWILLIIIMSIALVRNFSKTNALENEERTITVKVDFSEYFESEGIVTDREKEYAMYVFKIDRIDHPVNLSFLRNNAIFEGREENIGIYKVRLNDEYKYILYEFAKEPYYITNDMNNIEERIHRGNLIRYEKISDEPIYEVKIKKLDLRTITVKVDFSEYFESEKIIEDVNKEEYIQRYLENLDGIKNDSSKKVCFNKKYIRRDQNIGIYEMQIINDAEYIQYKTPLIYCIENEKNNIEKVDMEPEYGGDNRYYFNIEEVNTEQETYEVKLKRTKDLRKITVKVDFSKYFENEGITSNSIKESEMREYESKIKFTKYYDYDFVNGNTTKYINCEENIGIYEIQVLSDAKYLGFNIDDYTYKFINYIIKSDTNKVEDLCIEQIACYIVEINTEQEIYEVNFDRKVYNSRKLTIRVDFSKYFENEQITDEKKQSFIEDFYYNILGFSKTNNITKQSDIIYQSATFEGIEGNIGIYTINTITGEEKYILALVFDNRYILENSEINTSISLEFNLNGVQMELDKSEYELVYKKQDPKLYTNIKWEEDRKAKLEYNIEGLTPYYKIGNYSYYFQTQCIVFIERLDENFKIPDEYKYDPKWLVVNEDDIVNDKLSGLEKMPDGYIPKEIPEHVFSKLFKLKGDFFNIDKNVRYVYLKDKNILYSLVPYKESFSESINIELKDKVDKDTFKFNTEYIEFYIGSDGCVDDRQYYLKSELFEKEIKMNTEEKNNIVVNKLVNGEKGNNKYYVGLFENEEDEITDKIYSIDTIDGIGSIDVPIDNYNKSNNYYIYEVDEKGRKIVDENVIYNKNKVFETINLVYKYNILSDNKIVSSVFSDSPLEIGKESGEDYYINNNLVQSNVNEDIVTISSNYEEMVHLVKYETKKDGILDGKLQEVVKDGKRPVDIPNIIANDGYEFYKWVIIKDGEEIEVIPSEYVIYEDTTFIAKYRRVIENQDTSDINIWLYVGIAVISIIAIVIIVLFIILNKRKK